jgi:hypothetical protein
VEEVIGTVISVVIERGAEGVLLIGWVLYIIDHYYIWPKKEAAYQTKLDTRSSDLLAVMKTTNETVAGFSTLLEVIKDRQERR